MFTRIAVGIDGSPTSEAAAHVAIMLAMRERTEIHLISVIEELPQYVASHEGAASDMAQAQRYFSACHDRVTAEAERWGVSVTSHLAHGHEAQEIIALARAIGADVIVIGHAGHSAIWGTALGGTAHQIVQRTPCTALVVREHTPGMEFAHIAVALDGSPLGWEAFAVALDLSRSVHRPLHVLSVLEKAFPDQGDATAPTPQQSIVLHAQTRAIARATAAGTPVEVETRSGSASEQLIAAARAHEADLLIMGATGHERPWSQTTGGTAMKVVEEAPCAVLIVRPPTRGSLVRDVMSPAGTTVLAGTPLRDALILLLQQHHRLLPVVTEDHVLVGVVTLRSIVQQLDLAQALLISDQPTAVQVREQLMHLTEGHVVQDVMITQPAVVQSDVPLTVAGRYLTTHQITRAPVIEKSGQLVGVLSEHAIITTIVSAHGPQVSEVPSPSEEVGGIQTSSPIAGSLTVGMVTDRQVPMISEAAALDEVISVVQATAEGIVLVLGAGGQLRGVIDARTLLQRALPEAEQRRGAAIIRALTRSSASLVKLLRNLPEELTTAASLAQAPELVMAESMPLATALTALMTRQRSDWAVVVDNDGHPIGVLLEHRALRAVVQG